jgi:hypothetical protein
MNVNIIIKNFIVVLSCFSTFIVYSQITVQLPTNPIVDTIQKSWKGHNHSAFSDTSLFNNQMFADSFPIFHPGIIRWPAGNRSQNYKWEEQLKTTIKFFIIILTFIVG